MPRIHTVLSVMVLGVCWNSSTMAGEPPVAPIRQPTGDFRAGAAAVNIDPQTFPVLRNGNFLQATVNRVEQSLCARSLVLEDGTERLAICVVDSCMLPREICDRAKELAAQQSGIPEDHILISATHTHAAPSAMRVLGTPPDPEYPDFLMPRIADSIVLAARAVRPAQAGWGVADAGYYTNSRRWIFLPHKMREDPFGQKTVRAMMHPGCANPDTAGPSGPEDPDLTLLSIQDREGRPLAVLGNLSMHCFGASDLSSDFTGKVCLLLEETLGRQADTSSPPFVALMSQGTSGDLFHTDYSIPLEEQPFYRKPDGFERYCRGLTDLALQALGNVEYRSNLTLAMAETKLLLKRRVPDAERLAWAEPLVDGIQNVPKDLPEVYAAEAYWLRDNPEVELKLQAIRIGNFGITAIPDEVFGLTGLKLKMQSPLQPTMNVELANGSEGYIPPPEQHHLGGYTTWPARTAGLEVEAEPRIIEAVLELLEKVSGRPRRVVAEAIGSHGRELLAHDPQAWWRMSAHSGHLISDASGHGHVGRLEAGYALFLPGPGPESLEFASTERGNGCVQFAGGRMVADTLKLTGDYSISLWFWNAMPSDVRSVTGYFFSVGRGESSEGDHFGLSGTAQEHAGRLFFDNGNAQGEMLVGRTELVLHRWYHVLVVRENGAVSAYLDGHPEPEFAGSSTDTRPADNQVFVGGRSDQQFNFEGKIDEVAVFDRGLTAFELGQIYHSAFQNPDDETEHKSQ